MPPLNPSQRAAVEHGDPPLLVIAGAGSGKTMTLAHRVAHLVLSGVDPRRILLLTFTRRAAAEMIRRAERIVGGSTRIAWAGTFHSIANRLLRLHAEGVGLDPSFSVLDRGDSEDLLDLVRDERGLSGKASRFPKKGTCLAIYSHVVNSNGTLDATLERHFPWCASWLEELRGLFAAYVDSKLANRALDYDDLLLYWFHLMSEPALAASVRERFDHVLVDEYQDTNAIQAEILVGLKPDGKGLTVVGDDAQSIYSFRAATVRNILDFPKRFDPPARVVTLEQNYRSTRPILDASNAVIGLARERFTKDLWSERPSAQRPVLASVEDEAAQVDYVVHRILEHREAGVPLQQQAVLFRAAHHSDALEIELGRRNIPYHKYGGLKFLEAAHVKDLLSILRWAENPRDSVAAFRVLQILPGFGPANSRRALAWLEERLWELRALADYAPPSAAAEHWTPFCETMARLRDGRTEWAAQVGIVRAWYQPQLERLYESAGARASDLEQLENISGQYPSRERFLSEMALDPPDATGDEAGPPYLDEDFLILSTIHSAKGQEWDAVYVLNVADGSIPSDMSAGDALGIEEERRLLYVAMTRARDFLYLVHPLRYYVRQQHKHGDRHVYAPRSRFLAEPILERFERTAYAPTNGADDGARSRSAATVDVASKLRGMWK